jgi:hypothetical protein
VQAHGCRMLPRQHRDGPSHSSCHVRNQSPCQAHGGAGVSQDTVLARLWTAARTLRIADGPDEVREMRVAGGMRAMRRERCQALCRCPAMCGRATVRDARVRDAEGAARAAASRGWHGTPRKRCVPTVS